MSMPADFSSSSPASGRCRFCGCTEDRACPGGCGWVLPDVCSRCAQGELAAAGMDPWASVVLPREFVFQIMTAMAALATMLRGGLSGQSLPEQEAIAILKGAFLLLDAYAEMVELGAAPANEMLERLERARSKPAAPPVPRLWRPGDPL